MLVKFSGFQFPIRRFCRHSVLYNFCQLAKVARLFFSCVFKAIQLPSKSSFILIQLNSDWYNDLLTQPSITFVKGRPIVVQAPPMPIITMIMLSSSEKEMYARFTMRNQRKTPDGNRPSLVLSKTNKKLPWQEQSKKVFILKCDDQE